MENLEYQINKLSKMYNYFNNKLAFKILDKMTEEEKKYVLSMKSVEDTILKIRDKEVLKSIFRKVPAFFQEKMFENEETQALLLMPKNNLKVKDFLRKYNEVNFIFNEKDARVLEVFLRTIKSNKIKNQLPYNKLFQKIIAVCTPKVNPYFLKGINEVELFKQIISDNEIYSNQSRKVNIINFFNKTSNHFLFPEDYYKVVNPTPELIMKKKWKRENEQLIIDSKTLSFLTTKMIKTLLELKNVDSSVIKNYLENDLENEIEKDSFDFKGVFYHLTDKKEVGVFFHNFNFVNSSTFDDLDYFYFTKIIGRCRENEKVRNRFINFVYNILIDNEQLSKEEINLLKNNLYMKMASNNISQDDYRNLFSRIDTLKSIFYLKFGKVERRMDYLSGISPKQLIYLNNKHINQIVKKLNLENEDELSNIYSIAIKLYFIFGLERTLRILDGEYGKLDSFFYNNVAKIDVSKIEMEKEGNKYIPISTEEFNKFMFATKDNSHFSRILKDNNSMLSRYWNNLFNDFDSIKQECKGAITLQKLNIILQRYSPSKEITDVSPDDDKLNERDILDEICLGNKISKKNEEVYKDVVDIYSSMKKRQESSIPYVKGKLENGYSYEIMRMNDPIIFTLGYKTDSCFRTDDIAHKHMLHSALCRNGRILLIYDSLNNIVAFSPLKRNGEVLIANSIECAKKKENKLAIETFSEAVRNIVKTSKENEEEPISLVCIGTEAYAKPDGVEFPSNIPTPNIYEKDDPIYCNTDNYHKKLTIVYKDKDLNLRRIKYKNPEASYKDPRMKIVPCDFSTSSDKEIEDALKVINSVRYANSSLEEKGNYRAISKYGIKDCAYNEDWYILTNHDKIIYGEYLDYDERAKKEFDVALKEFEKRNYLPVIEGKRLVKGWR